MLQSCFNYSHSKFTSDLRKQAAGGGRLFTSCSGSFQSRYVVFLCTFHQPSFGVYIYICQFVQFIYISQPYAFKGRRASVEPKATEKLPNRLRNEIIVSNAAFLPHGTGLNPFDSLLTFVTRCLAFHCKYEIAVHLKYITWKCRDVIRICICNLIWIWPMCCSTGYRLISGFEF